MPVIMARGNQKNGSVSSDSAFQTGHDQLDRKESQILNTQAFSDLSRKIQAKFSKLNNGSPKEDRKQNKKSDIQGTKDTASKPSSASANTKTQHRGKKRDNQGVVKDQGKDMVLDGPASTKTPSTDTKTLEKEVYALGGTAEDLALIANLDSESELEDEGRPKKNSQETKFDKGLKKGIADILKQIDASGVVPDDINEEENSAGEEDGEEEQTDNESSYATPFTGDTTVSASRSGKANLLIMPRSDWFNVPLPSIKGSKTVDSKTLSDQVQYLYREAKSLLDAENEAFKASQQSSSSQNFYSTVIASGTLSDKISALTLAVQESPLHNVKALETLISLGKKRSRAQAVDVLRALKDLFAQGSLLPNDRKLHAFSAHPDVLAIMGQLKNSKGGDSLPAPLQPQHLIVWAYESWLKEKYFEVLKTLEIWCNDEIEFSKSRAVTFVFDLLKEKPEQESNLLRLLTNKLGDPSKKIASHTSYLLMQLMVAHPLMKMTIISSIEFDLLFRPGQSLHAKYYAAITLNQTTLSRKEEEVASKLLDIYFSLFVGLLKPGADEKGTTNEKSEAKTSTKGHGKSLKKQSSKDENGQAEDLREKLTAAILTGINRAYPYTESNNQSLSTHLETLFKITHSSNFNTSIQAMMLIQQLCSSHQASADRFYRTLYESLLDARLIASSKQSMYLNLLYRSLKADGSVKRVKAFVKRILQMLAVHQPSFICGCFFLLQELNRTFPSLSALIDQPEEHGLDEEIYEDVREPEDGIPMRKEPQTLPLTNNAYDSRKRDPEYSNADNSCLWELIPFLAHFHPSVSVSAEHILGGINLPGKPDLELHTLIHFLDRFAYRTAKIGSSRLRGSSIMQPLVGGDTADLLVSSTLGGQLPVNSEKFWARRSEDVPPEDAFFHQYFNNIGKMTHASKKSKKMRKDGDEEGSEEEESEIWKAMMESAPELEGVDDSDDDLQMSDLDSQFEASSNESPDEDGRHEIESAASSDKGLDSDLDMALARESSESASDHDYPLKTKSPGDGRKTSKSHRKWKHLPTFAAADSYAKMIDDEDGEDLG